MTHSRPTVPSADRYWLTNAHVPVSLLTEAIAPQTPDGLALLDLEIHNGCIRQIAAGSSHAADSDAIPQVDLQRGIVFPCFVDMHTHLDKGHVWERSPNPSGSFEAALEIVNADADANWSADDVYRRMEFGLKCSYAHGTKAIRTHLDSAGKQGAISFEVFRTLREEWRDRITLQAVSLVPLEYFLTPEGEKLADLVVESGGVLGGVAFANPDLDRQIERVFELAIERNLLLDFHTDESGDPADIALRRLAQAATQHQFSGQIVCGHCCSLAIQTQADVEATISAVQKANLGVVSLPMCNLYLQDRNQYATADLQRPDSGKSLAHLPDRAAYTPRWRGVTLLHELAQADIPVAIASDNCRDPFYAFGDHDALEVLVQGVRIAHLDAPYGHWCHVVTRTPADLLGLPDTGRIGVGLPADLVLFSARYFSELYARSQHDRIVLRQGQPIDTTLPSYADLDDLMQK
ncbi:MAG: cytosine deaminase [Kaiparowitsia implicata GSE-PSE-MK54-09C]|jgi:cytosine deaminase|nr:cytosine deaminase [Kaiparowitsia implicata GSE-PSE-MK54-09C]